MSAMLCMDRADVNDRQKNSPLEGGEWRGFGGLT